MSLNLRLILTILAPVIVTGIGLVLIFWATAVYLRLVYQLPGDQRPGSILERRLLGIPLYPPPLSWVMPGAFLVLQEAVLEDNHWARLVGGPVRLIVFDGVALYLESGDRFSRVVGPGNHLLGLHERIKELIDLKPQMKTGYVKPWTKDGIRIKLTLMVECQIAANPAAQAASEDPDHPLRYPFDEDAVKRAVEHMTVKENGGELRQADWLEGAWGSITGAINAYVARHTLDELFLAATTPITNPAAYTGMIAQLLSDKFSAVLLGKLNSALVNNGSKALNIQITEVEVPKDVLALRIRHWESVKEILSARKISKAEADGIRVRRQAFVLAQQTMLKTITEKLEKVDPDNLTEPLILSLSGLLDQGLNDPIVRPLLAKESFAALERLKKLLDQEF